MAMSEKQMYQALEQAGWPDEAQDRAVCISQEESGWDPWAVGDKNLAPKKGPSYGLFQIDYAFHPDFDLTRWYDPVYNASYALMLWKSNGGSFEGVWSTAGECP